MRIDTPKDVHDKKKAPIEVFDKQKAPVETFGEQEIIDHHLIKSCLNHQFF